MKLGWPVEIAGMGAGVPKRAIANEEFVGRLDTSDEWIVQRTGIRVRRMVGPGESTLSLATDASQQAMAEAGIGPQDIDLVVVGTVTPQHTLPSTACELQAALKLGWVPAFDLVAACSGFLYGLMTASQYILSGLCNTALVVGAETLSRITDMEDRNTAVLFGDASGAAIVRRATDDRRKLLAAHMGADERLHYMRMNGREIYKFAVTQMHELVEKTLADAGESIDHVKLLVPHQSNLRIIESAVERLKIPMDRVMVNIDRYGNTSAASVPVALCEARRQGRLEPGDLVMLVAFGAGLTWASVLLRV
ncbi:MAG: ketoacyl-ACP synthase III [Planctomycetes bacterium]|nr:ketoacyl-ACP synthase III [Planctomycetota bacterium]